MSTSAQTAAVSLNPEELRKLCELARLEIGPGEEADLGAKLGSILAMMNRLKEVPTAGIEPLAHPLDRAQRLRPDEVTEQDEHRLYQQNAPLVERDLYLVPKVID